MEVRRRRILYLRGVQNMKKTILGVCLLGLFVLSAESSYACECMQRSITAWGELQTADAVFTGKIVSIRQVKVSVRDDGTFFYELEVRLKVGRVLKGIEGTEVTLYTGAGAGGDCGFRFKKGQKYLIYAYSSNKRLETDSCSRTKLLTHATQDFKEIEAGVEIDTNRDIKSPLP